MEAKISDGRTLDSQPLTLNQLPMSPELVTGRFLRQE